MSKLTQGYSYFFAPFLKESYKSDEAIFRTRYTKCWFFLFLVLVVFIPIFLNEFHLYFLSLLGIAVLGAMGLNILFGYTGLISLGHAAFLGVGTYTYAILVVKLNFPFFFGILGAGIVTAFIGMFIGIPALRIKGIYLAVATVAFQFIAMYVFVHWESVTGGARGILISSPRLGPWILSSNFSFYYIMLVFVSLGLWMAKNLFNSKHGRALMAIRDNDISAEVMGIPVFKYKILSFMISSFYAGVAGALLGILMRNVNPTFFDLRTSIEYLAMVIIGGMGTVVGAILGASFMAVLPELLRVLIGTFSNYFESPQEIIVILSPVKLILVGFFIIFFIHIEPTGIAGIWRRVRDYFKIWPLPYF
jgi:branched-chain amino acid transport system permease protein